MSNIFNSRFLGINSDFRRAVERLNDAAQNTISYPKYNLYTSDDGDHVLIEIAVAGFSKNEISVTQDSKVLTIKASSDKGRPISEDLIQRHHGISNKDFNLTWHINNGLEVQYAEITDGILTVVLKSQHKEDHVRVIPIN